MPFFRNRTVNLLNLHYGVHAVALSGGAAFFTVYLLKAGVSVQGVLLSLAAILLGRLALRPMVVPLGVRFGLRALVIAGTLMSAAQYALLARVHGVGPALYLLCAVSSAGDTLYWTSYHSYFAALGDHEHRGSQTSMREAIAAGVGIIAPIATAFGLTLVGAVPVFLLTTCVVALSAVPLFFTPDVAVEPHVPGAFKASLSGAGLFAADGWNGAGFYFVWQIVLFFTLRQDFLDFGGALAAAALVGAIGGLVLGHNIDAGHGARAAWIAASAMAAVIILRFFAPGQPALAVAANALGALSACLYLPTLLTAVYNQAKRSPSILRFHVAAEGGWDVGGSSALLITALLVHLGVKLPYGLLLSLLGIAAAFLQLRRYFSGVRQHTN
ncbi:MAG TPA: MFS transporter [Rhizomicrobium sp.]|nr:MFS transporter [Rhizomicrobium sp.]